MRRVPHVIVCAALAVCGCKPTPIARAPAEAVTIAETGSPKADEAMQVRRVQTYTDAYSTALVFAAGTGDLFGSSTNGTWRFGETATAIDAAPRARHHLRVSPDAKTLYVDATRWSLETGQEVPWDQEPARRDGYETREAGFTTNGRWVVVHRAFRPPRGIPITNPDGTRGYRYAGPSEPSQGRKFVSIRDTGDGSEKMRLASSLDRFAFTDRLAAGRDGTAVVIIDVEARTERRLEGVERFLSALALAPDGGFLVAIDFEGRLFSWRGKDWEPDLVGHATRAGEPTTIAVHRSGTVFVGWADGTMTLHDPRSGAQLFEWEHVPATAQHEVDHRVAAAAFSPDGRKLATSHGLLGSEVNLWELSGL